MTNPNFAPYNVEPVSVMPDSLAKDGYNPTLYGGSWYKSDIPTYYRDEPYVGNFPDEAVRFMTSVSYS